MRDGRRGWQALTIAISSATGQTRRIRSGQAARAFLAGPGQGVTYRVDTWHHPLTVLDRAARFAVLIWLERSQTDEEFVTLDRPFTVEIPA